MKPHAQAGVLANDCRPPCPRTTVSNGMEWCRFPSARAGPSHMFLSSFSLVPPLVSPTCRTTVGDLVGVPGKYQIKVQVQVRGRVS